MSYYVYLITLDQYLVKEFPTKQQAEEEGAELFSHIPDNELDKVLMLMKEGEISQETINVMMQKIKIYNSIDKANRIGSLVDFISLEHENMLH
jgi:hypothetical protein